jgi:hypothetical protein
MKFCILSVIIFFQSFSTSSQQYDRKIIRAGESLSDYFTYRFPSFEEATILFKNGGTSRYKMNFNMLLYSMQFINPKGDTLEISNPESIDSIRLNNCTFFFRDNYFEIIAAVDSVKLVILRKASFEPVLLGAMDRPERTASIEGIAGNDSRLPMPMNLRFNQDTYVYEKIDYFLITGKGEFIKATKPNFLEIFNDDKKNIENFLKSNRTNFNKQNDVEKLFRFCTHT